MPSPYRCFIISSFQCQSFFSLFFSFLFFFFFLCVCIIIICPERALSEGGLFVLQPGSQLFSGSAVFFSSPSVQFEYPREIWLCLWYLFLCPAVLLFLLISLQFAKILSLILTSNCLLRFFFLFPSCPKDICRYHCTRQKKKIKTLFFNLACFFF